MPKGWVATLIAEVVVAIAMHRMYQQRELPAREDPDGGGRVIEIGWAIRAILAAGIPLFVGLTVLALYRPDFPNRQVVLAGFFAVISVDATLEAFFGRLILGERTIVSHSPWHLPLELTWDEVDRVTYSAWTQCYVLHATSGRRISVSTGATGADEFEDACRKHRKYG